MRDCTMCSVWSPTTMRWPTYDQKPGLNSLACGTSTTSGARPWSCKLGRTSGNPTTDCFPILPSAFGSWRQAERMKSGFDPQVIWRDTWTFSSPLLSPCHFLAWQKSLHCILRPQHINTLTFPTILSILNFISLLSVTVAGCTADTLSLCINMNSSLHPYCRC